MVVLASDPEGQEVAALPNLSLLPDRWAKVWDDLVNVGQELLHQAIAAGDHDAEMAAETLVTTALAEKTRLARAAKRRG